MTDTQQLDAVVAEYISLFKDSTPNDSVIQAYVSKFKSILNPAKTKEE